MIIFELSIKDRKIIFLNTKERTFYIDFRKVFYVWIGPDPWKPEGRIEYELGLFGKLWVL